ncbi:Hemerythrin HHE cation binding domain protein [Leifsonia rubra CMS 76R]|nr:Hemerythrin HHE cation binding domain protein [Leifsonia rubra CMS 76R]
MISETETPMSSARKLGEVYGEVMAIEPIELKTSGTATSNDSGCACGHEDTSEIVLDVRTIPHAIRHATIFGALGSIAPGFSLDIVADHNPLPLLAQLEQKQPGDFSVSYVTDGPDEWKVRFTRA